MYIPNSLSLTRLKILEGNENATRNLKARLQDHPKYVVCLDSLKVDVETDTTNA
jgi:hypothetical protein